LVVAEKFAAKVAVVAWAFAIAAFDVVVAVLAFFGVDVVVVLVADSSPAVDAAVERVEHGEDGWVIRRDEDERVPLEWGHRGDEVGRGTGDR
jgi:uncharacterized membrane protein